MTLQGKIYAPAQPSEPCDRRYDDGGAYTGMVINGEACCSICRQPFVKHKVKTTPKPPNPTPREEPKMKREELKKPLIEVLFRFAGVYMDDPAYTLMITEQHREPTINLDEALDQLKKLFNQHADQLCREARLNELGRADKHLLKQHGQCLYFDERMADIKQLEDGELERGES